MSSIYTRENLDLAKLRTLNDLTAFIAKLENNKLSLMARRPHRYSRVRRAFCFNESDSPSRVMWLYDDGATSGECNIRNLHRWLYVTEGRTLPYIDITNGAEVY